MMSHDGVRPCWAARKVIQLARRNGGPSFTGAGPKQLLQVRTLRAHWCADRWIEQPHETCLRRATTIG
jgi:hypothetical protein